MLKRGKMDRDVVEIVGIDSLVPKEHLLRKIDNDKGAVDYQVTNHNMFLTSIKASDGEATSRIIQRSPYVVIDEAHKLLEASQATLP